MIGRDYKPNFEGAYFHVYNRGAGKNLVFLDDQDYLAFLYRAKILLGLEPPPKRTFKGGGLRLKVLPLNAVEVLCYCLMPNHFHFLIKQNQKDGVKKFLHRLCTSYSSYFNRKYNHSGHVFQGIYKSKIILEESYLTQLTAYIHFNPERPFNWKYSSMACYLGQNTTDLAKPTMFMDMHKLTPAKYKTFLIKNYNPQNLLVADLLFQED